MIGKRSLLLILYFVITSCTIDCVEPGLQSRNTSVNVSIPVREVDDKDDDKKTKIFWVDSNQVIKEKKKIKFSIGGSITFCPSKKNDNSREKNSKEVIVPASFCADGSELDYSKAKDIDSEPDNYGIYEPELCKGKRFGGSRRYVDTRIRVNPGDSLTFNLISRNVKVDYDNLTNKVTFDDNCYRTEKGDEKVPVSGILNISTEEKFFCEGKGNERNEIIFSPLDTVKKNKLEKVKTNEVLVGNGYTPYDNKVHFNIYRISTQEEWPWMVGALSDLRRAKIGLNELCDEERENGEGWTARCGLKKMKKYNSYELNCYHQNICYNKEGMWNPNLARRSCVSSIRYEKYDKGNKCDMYSYLDQVQDDLESSLKITNDSWAEALVAKVSNPYTGDQGDGERDDMKDTARGTQCLPKDNGSEDDMMCSKISSNINKLDFKDFSLKLNHDYKVNESVTPGSSVMLAIASSGDYHLHGGGYNVKVSKSCEFTGGEKLYVYLGDSPPKYFITSTDNFKKVIELTKTTEDNIDYYTIDGSNLIEPKKIYFGIDVSNITKDDITYQAEGASKEKRYHKNNKYDVNLLVQKEINDFISRNVNAIFNFLKEDVVNQSSTKSAYGRYKIGLIQTVKVVLVLYVIFTVIGYMLGTIQLSKYDFIVRITKIALIAFAFSERSWNFFGKNLILLFVDGSNYLVDSFSGHMGTQGKKFEFLDLTAGILLTGETWLKFLSLMLSGPFGFIAFFMILYATFVFLTCVISATVKYIIALVLGAFLLSLAPLFIVFILFQRTKHLFYGWINTLSHISLQPIILFSSLSLLNQLMYSVLYNLTNFSACYQCLISMEFFGLGYKFCLMKSMLPLGYGPGTSVDVALNSGERTSGFFAALPIDLIQAIIYLMIASIMKAFVSISESMGQAIFHASYGVVGGVSHAAQSASQAALSTVGLDNQTQSMIKYVKKREGFKDRNKMNFQLPSSNTQEPRQQAPWQSGQQWERERSGTRSEKDD
ncbi:MAG: type IV secretion system protein [Wolbachia sp.]|nr:type IV secretion system protein [Wolbachia sp.]MDD9336588.1 type IV secretion system protein [Wolbachia sp.]